jgi:intergrase/recombinase
VYLETTGLARLQDRGFCRYYVGIRGSQKPCEWAYFPTKTLKLLEEYAGERVDGSSVRKYTKRNGLPPPKYVRKAAWRLMVEAMPREVVRFVQSRFGELKMSEARYEDLLGEADEYLPGYLSYIQSTLSNELYALLK